MTVIVIILKCTDDTHCPGELSCNKGLCGGNLMFRQPKSTFVRKFVYKIYVGVVVYSILSQLQLARRYQIFLTQRINIVIDALICTNRNVVLAAVGEVEYY